MMFDNDNKKDITDSFRVLESKLDDKFIHSGLVGDNFPISSINFDKKCLISFCGNNTRDPMRAKFYTYCHYNWLREYPKRDEITTYAFYYPKDQPLFNNFTPDLSFDYDSLADNLFGKLITGNKNNIKAITDKLDNVVFTGHSAGGLVMNNLMYGLDKLLREHNFSESDIHTIYDHIVFIAYSPFELVDMPIKAIYIAPIHDTLGSTKLVYDKMLQYNDIISSNPTVNFLQQPLPDTYYYYEFLTLYKQAINNAETTYFANKNLFIATPNLLLKGDPTSPFLDDHAISVVSRDSGPEKTKAGLQTSKDIKKIFNYVYSTQRSKFSTKKLFVIITQPGKQYNENTIGSL